jgi:hypothetical protein
MREPIGRLQGVDLNMPFKTHHTVAKRGRTRWQVKDGLHQPQVAKRGAIEVTIVEIGRQVFRPAAWGKALGNRQGEAGLRGQAKHARREHDGVVGPGHVHGEDRTEDQQDDDPWQCLASFSRTPASLLRVEWCE